MATITIIIPTACEARRAALLHRALDSIVGQEGVDVHPVVVVNGARVDESLCASIVARPGVTVLRRDEGNVSAARRAGMRLVDGAYFGFLDDDDEFLPGALRVRAEHLDRDGAVDVVFTNGRVRTHDGDEPMAHAGQGLDVRQVETFLEAKRLASCGCLFRAARVDASHFETRHVYFEWSDVLFRLVAANRHFAYVDAITFRKYEDHPVSMSRSDASRLAYPAFLAELVERPLPRTVRAALQQRFHRALNDASRLCLARGNLRGAAGYHAWCLMNGGWRYAPYTGKIVAAGWRRLVAGAAVAPVAGRVD
jgi:glycosyltransferase involved in cell wall biosynthesis